jgi:hypothetical protein
MTAVAGVIAKYYGPVIGGLFLSCPAIFPASATLIEKHAQQKKACVGLKGLYVLETRRALMRRGRPSGITWKFLPGHSVWLVPLGCHNRLASSVGVALATPEKRLGVAGQAPSTFMTWYKLSQSMMQLCVFHLGVLQDGDLAVGLVPEGDRARMKTPNLITFCAECRQKFHSGDICSGM